MNKQKVNDLISFALKMCEKSYSPYSNFKVGAAFLLKNGQMVGGTNIENASFSLCNCAERVALASLVKDGTDLKSVEALAVVTDTKILCYPCGACRQVLVEFFPDNFPIYLSDHQNHEVKITLGELLPHAFRKDSLEG